jgi:hypothetical protein
MVLERLVGQFTLGDVETTGLADKHKRDPRADGKAYSAPGSFHAETCTPDTVIGFDHAIQIIETVDC